MINLYDAQGHNLDTAPNLDADDYLRLAEANNSVNLEVAENVFMGIVLLDNNYKYFSVANIESIVDTMSSVGLNYLMLGFGGSGKGLGLKLDNMTIEVNGTAYDLTNCIRTSSGKYLTENDMVDIITYARGKNVEIIPYLNMPGHFNAFLRKYPQFGYNNSTNSVDIDNPQAVSFAVEVAKLYMAFFAKYNIRYWNIGADEFNNSGYYDLYLAKNYNYAKFLNKVAYWATFYRMIPIFYNDAMLFDNDVIPYIIRNAPVAYWAKRASNWGTPKQIEAIGHKMINSSQGIYWVANGSQVSEENIRNFNIRSFFSGDGRTIQNPLGACFCIWIGERESPALDDDGNAITESVLPLIAAFGETIAAQIGT